MTKTHRDVELLGPLWRNHHTLAHALRGVLADRIDLSLPQFLALRAARATADDPSPAEKSRSPASSRANASELLATLVRTERIASMPTETTAAAPG